jgi:ATP-binding protein involved in chromosome partitioning
MLQITETAVMDALRQVQEPELGGDLVTRNMVRDLVIDGTKVAFQIELTTPACPLKDEIESRVHAALDPIGVETVELTWGATVRRAAPRTPEQLLPGVKNVLAVASGKGGVGKSTVAVNLAVALARDGAAVGLLDADITGPNVPLMLGLEGQPIVWRGPLVGGAIQQFLRDVAWGDLDYLVVDLPPGTSDAQLTLAQAVPLSGALLVTTPQDVALLDVEKALAMFKRLSVPVLGVVENMSNFICPHCGEATEIFGRGGGEKFARDHGLEYFGGVPIDIKVRQGGDAGVPAVAQREQGAAAVVLTLLARTLAARMSVRAARQQPVLTIS